MASIIKFQVGRVYWTTSACDHECVFSFTVVRRSQKTVWIEYHGKVTGRRVTIDDYYQAESIMPLGTYSMAPVLTAMDCDGLKGQKGDRRRSFREVVHARCDRVAEFYGGPSIMAPGSEVRQ